MSEKRVGRPSKYTPELAKEICTRIESGRTTLDVSKDPDMPDRATITRWVSTNDEFRAMYEKAREKLYEHWADQVLEIPDDPDLGDMAQIQRAKLRLDSRKWLLSKLRPRQYGDRIAVDADVKLTANYDQILAEATALGLNASDVFGG